MTTLIPPEGDLGALPALPRDDKGPVFKAPWEAQAFAMTLTLHTRGVFEWREWAEVLAAELAALETLVARKKLIAEDELEHRVDEWDAAARATPHGKPIELPPR